MALVEGCKHSLEISIPVDEVQGETARVVADVQKRAKLPGFRPGKVPESIVRSTFGGEIRRQVLENLIPKALQRQFETDGVHAIGTPDVSDLHFHDGEPLRFKATFEVFPEIELGQYQGVEVQYADPEVSSEDVDKRLEEIREQKAEQVNIEPRPAEDGDLAVVSLESTAGVDGEPVKTDEVVLELGAKDTLDGFTENLRGLTPGDEKDFDVTYPENYGSQRLSGKTVTFHATLKQLRRKELPDLDDEFAQELGDYRTLDELKDAVRKAIFSQRQYEAQQTAKNTIVDKLVDTHEFPVPEAFIDKQIQNRVEQTVRGMAAEGVDLRNMKLDWEKVKEAQRDKAVREVKASLLLGKISEREHIAATRDEVDREVEKAARQQRKPVAAVHVEFEKDGTLGRIANHIQTEKTLNYLFEQARKTA